MKTAAFFRVEGTLVQRPSLAAAAWMAGNASGLGERVARLSNVAMAAPLSWMGELAVGSAATRVTWMGLRGMSEDRLSVLVEEYFDTYLREDVRDVGRELLALARSEGRRIVLISDGIARVLTPLAELLHADDLICNRLEMHQGRATGRLEDPVIGGNLAGQWARSFASEHSIDLNSSWAYGASATDSLLLSAIGQPCAVNPDSRLRRIAKDHGWPVLDG